MGAGMSLIPKVGNPTKLLTDRIFDSMEQDIKDFEHFHVAFLEVLNKINAAMPGVHYDAPPRKEVKESYDSWMKEKDREKARGVLTALLQKSNISKTDNAVLLTGVATPPVAMIGKRAAGNIPTLNFVKLVPDVVFVPSITLLAVVGMKYARMNRKIPEATAKTKGPAETPPHTKGPAETPPHTKGPAKTQTTANTSTDATTGDTSTDATKSNTSPKS